MYVFIALNNFFGHKILIFIGLTLFNLNLWVKRKKKILVFFLFCFGFFLFFFPNLPLAG